MNIFELREQSVALQHEARAKLDEASAAAKAKDESRAAELEAQADKIFAEIEKVEARATKLEKLDALEKAYNEADPRRPVEDRQAKPVTEAAEKRAAAFDNYLRRGMTFVSEADRHELRAMTSTVGSEGGYTVPTSMGDKIIEAVKYTGPMFREDVTFHLITPAGERINWPTNDDTANSAAAKAQNAASTAVDLTFGTKPLDAYTRTSMVLVPNELLQDTGYDLQGFIAGALGKRLGRVFNTDLTTGDGNGNPNGILTAVGTPSLETAAANLITHDDILELIHSVDVEYRGAPGCGFLVHDSDVLRLRKLKDGNGNYIWNENTRVGEPATLFGYPVFKNNALTAGVADNNVPVLFGNLKEYYVRRAGSIVIRRLDERFAVEGQVAFLGAARIDGELMNSGAVKGLKVKAA